MKAIRFLLTVLLAGYLITYLLTWISPKIFPLINLASVIVPYYACITLIVSIFIILSNRKLKWLALATLVFTLPVLWKSFYIPAPNKQSTTNETLSIFDYNVSFFSVKRVFKPIYYKREHNQIVEKIRNTALETQPDIICFQEFFNDKNSPFYNTMERMDSLGYDHFLKSSPRHDNGLNRGLITFSKHPIVASGIIAEASKAYNGAIYTDVKISASKIIRVINVHLSSMELFLGKRTALNMAKFFLRTYTNAAEERQDQLAKIKSFIEDSPYEVIVCGDFNETQYSYTYKQIKSLLNNSQESVGGGFGATFPSKVPGLSFRIDHMFYSDALEAHKFHTFKKLQYSEHKPILGTFEIN